MFCIEPAHEPCNMPVHWPKYFQVNESGPSGIRQRRRTRLPTPGNPMRQVWFRWSPGIPQTYLESLVCFRSASDGILTTYVVTLSLGVMWLRVNDGADGRAFRSRTVRRCAATN